MTTTPEVTQMTPSPFVVETTGLTKRFGARTVVQDVELQVPRGSAFGYLGLNGAGKTTLIRMLLGLTPATSGSMRLLGLPVPGRRRGARTRRSDRRGAPLPRLPDRPREPRDRRRGTRPRGRAPYRRLDRTRRPCPARRRP